MSNTFLYDSNLPYDSEQEFDPYQPSVTPQADNVLAHLAAPVMLGGDGSFLFLLQDTESEVAQSVEVICDTTVGDRVFVPTFGLPQQVFTQPSKIAIENAISLWEPRAAVGVTVDTTDPGGVANISVAVSLLKHGVGTSS